jgi:hypothetical protein
MSDRARDLIEDLLAYAYACGQQELEVSLRVREALCSQDFIKVCSLIHEHESVFNLNASLLEAKGIAMLCLGNPQGALNAFAELRRLYPRSSIPAESSGCIVPNKALVTPSSPELNSDLIGHAPSMSSNITATVKNTCIYTSLYGGNDRLLPAISAKLGIDYLCFTDQPITAPDWKVITIQDPVSDPAIASRCHKILPHKWLPQKYEFSLYIDANLLLLGDIRRLIEIYSATSDLCLWPHPDRCCVYREIAAAYYHRGIDPQPLCRKAIEYQFNGLPASSGLAHAAMIWRRHRDLDVIHFCEQWWREIGEGVKRDQPALGYTLWKMKSKSVSAIKSSLGSIDNNFFSLRVPHLDSSSCEKVHILNSIDAQPYCRHFSSTQVNIVFALSAHYLKSGSTVLRGSQLAKLIAADPQITDKFSVASATDVTQVDNSLIFMTKGALACSTAEELASLKRRGNLLLGDFLDAAIDHDKARLMDVLVASSLSQLSHFVAEYPSIPAAHVTHHVDLRLQSRISESAANIKTLGPRKIGYFGLAENTRIPAHVSTLIDECYISTSSQDDLSWMSRVCEYPLHYGIRKTREIDGHKPSLKLFIAAVSNAAIIVEQGVYDNSYYLGDSYPFYVSANADDDEIAETVDRALGSIGTPLFDHALEVMSRVRERCSNEWVLDEFKSMLSLIV